MSTTPTTQSTNQKESVQEDQVLVTATLPSPDDVEKTLQRISGRDLAIYRKETVAVRPAEPHPSRRAVFAGSLIGAILGGAVGVGSTMAMNFAGRPGDEGFGINHGTTLVLFVAIGVLTLGAFGAVVGMAIPSRKPGPVEFRAWTKREDSPVLRSLLSEAKALRITVD